MNWRVISTTRQLAVLLHLPAMLGVVVILVAGLALAQSDIGHNCLSCICKVESNCRNVGCRMDVGSLSCGPYQIKKPYWIDCGRPGRSWKSCAQDFTCAANCVRAYTARYGKPCTGNNSQTCRDYARIHNGGPRGCRKSATLGYWRKVQRCLN